MEFGFYPRAHYVCSVKPFNHLKKLNMKKLPLFILAAALTVFATSCSKEKTCDCVTDVMGIQSSSTVVIEDGDCSDMDYSTTQLGITTSVECTEQ